MIIVMPTRIVANVNLIPCPWIAPARTATDSIILTKENISQKEWDLLNWGHEEHLGLWQFVAS